MKVLDDCVRADERPVYKYKRPADDRCRRRSRPQDDCSADVGPFIGPVLLCRDCFC